MVKTLIFVVKTDFLMFRTTNFLDHEISWSQNFLVNLHSIPFMLNPIPFQFYAQLHSVPTAFHGQWQDRIGNAYTCTYFDNTTAATLQK